jgi:hypothetical protein
LALNETFTLRIDVLRVEHSQEPILSTIAEIAANLLKLELRAETFISNTAGQQAMAGDELMAFFKVAEGGNFQSERIPDSNSIPLISSLTVFA